MTSEIGRRLRSIRVSKGKGNFWSLRSVSKRAGISDSYLSQLETGQVKQPSPSILKRLSGALNHPYQELLCVCSYLPRQKEKSGVSEIPFYENYSNQQDASKKRGLFLISRSVTGDRNCFALRIQEDCGKSSGISKGDIAVATTEAELKNGDFVIAKTEKGLLIKKYYSMNFGKSKRILLQSCNQDPALDILQSDPSPAIMGKVILVIKQFT